MHIYRKPALNDVQALLDLHDLPASDLDEDATVMMKALRD